MAKQPKQYGEYVDGNVVHLMTISSLMGWAVSVAHCSFERVGSKASSTSPWQETTAKLHIPWDAVTRIRPARADQIFKQMRQQAETDRAGMSIYG